MPLNPCTVNTRQDLSTAYPVCTPLKMTMGETAKAAALMCGRLHALPLSVVSIVILSYVEESRAICADNGHSEIRSTPFTAFTLARNDPMGGATVKCGKLFACKPLRRA